MALLWQLSPFFLAVWLLILLVPVRINLFFLREDKDDHLVIRINTFFSAVRILVEVPLLKQETPLDVTLEAEVKAGGDGLVEEKKKKFTVFDLNLEKLQWLLWVYQNNRRLVMYAIRFMTQALTVERFHFSFSGGLNDAALTGLLFGAGWTVAANLLALAQKKVHFRERPQVDLRPDFRQAPGQYTRFDTVISCRVGHFLLAGLLLIAAIIRGGEKRRWTTILSRD